MEVLEVLAFIPDSPSAAVGSNESRSDSEPGCGGMPSAAASASLCGNGAVWGENSQNSAVTTEGSVLTCFNVMDQERSRARQLRICDFSRILEVQEVDLLRGFISIPQQGSPDFHIFLGWGEHYKHFKHILVLLLEPVAI